MSDPATEDFNRLQLCPVCNRWHGGQPCFNMGDITSPARVTFTEPDDHGHKHPVSRSWRLGCPGFTAY